MEIKKSSIVVGFVCYSFWGILPAYWNLLGGVDNLLIICCRIAFAFVFLLGVMLATGRKQLFLKTIRDKAAMRFLIPSSLLITFNWGLYVWAVNNGRILDTSLGYYMNPLISFLFGVVIFKEKSTRLQLVAVGLAFTGVVISLIAYGSVPYVSLGLSLSFAAYGVLKKKARTDPISGIAIESLLVTPLAVAIALIFTTDSIRAAGAADILLLIGAGAVTAFPLVLYSYAVNQMPYIIVGFIQYISPSIGLTYGLLIGERLSPPRVVSFIFIGLGLIVFSTAMVLNNKKAKRLQALQHRN